jgi:hypothetical protein
MSHLGKEAEIHILYKSNEGRHKIDATMNELESIPNLAESNSPISLPRSAPKNQTPHHDPIAP